MERFYKLIEEQGLRYFKPHELLFKGDRHSNPNNRAFGKNTDPPEELWANIIPTIKILDELRHRIGYPIVLSSIYRSPEYNKIIGGNSNSLHIQFKAIDFSVRGPSAPSDWAAILKSMRAVGDFSGGIGVYSTFVHVDTRGTNQDW